MSGVTEGSVTRREAKLVRLIEAALLQIGFRVRLGSDCWGLLLPMVPSPFQLNARGVIAGQSAA